MGLRLECGLIFRQYPCGNLNLKETHMAKYKLVCTLDLADILIQFLLWLVLIAVTFGIAIPFFGYYFVRIIINHTEIHQTA